MEKPADIQYPISDDLKRRWSPRAFAAKPVPTEVLLSLLEAARWAPSCFGEEPWRYLIATRENESDFQTMLSCLVERNQKWAQSAPVLMISCAKKTFTKGGKPNRHAWHDVGQASAQLTVEAVHRGLFVHQMAGIDSDKIRQTYNIPEDFEPVAGVAIGYAGELSRIPDMFHASENAVRSRRDPKELFFHKLWGEPLDELKGAAKD